MQPAFPPQFAPGRKKLSALPFFEAARPKVDRLSAQFDEARQKPGQGLAAAGRRDQEHGAARLRLRQQIELMRARRPAAAGEPAKEKRW